MLNRAPGRVGGDLSGMDVGRSLDPWLPGRCWASGLGSEDHYQLVTCTIPAGLCLQGFAKAGSGRPLLGGHLPSAWPHPHPGQGCEPFPVVLVTLGQRQATKNCQPSDLRKW